MDSSHSPLRGPRISLLALVVCGLLLSTAGHAQEEAPFFESVLWLGPLPQSPIFEKGGDLAPTLEMVPELDVRRIRPESGETYLLAPGKALSFRPTKLPLSLNPGVHWIASQLWSDRRAEIEFSVDYAHGITVYVEGEEKEHRAVADGSDESLAIDLTLGRGSHRILVRLESVPTKTEKEAVPAQGGRAGKGGRVGKGGASGQDSEAASVSMAVSGEDRAALHANSVSAAPPARFDQTRGVRYINSVRIGPSARRIARSLFVRDPDGDGSETITELLNRQGFVVNSFRGGEGMSVVDFMPGGRQALLRRSHDDGSDLLLWPLPNGAPTVLLKDEPGLDNIRFSPDGTYLLFTSTKGSEEAQPEDGPRRQRHFRGSISDYTPGESIHMLELKSGARRRLTNSGDWVLDDVVFAPQLGSVLYVRTLPSKARPWFVSEFRLVDLFTGEDKLMKSYVAGWEVRPTDLAISPDGIRVAFLGPPEQTGEGHGEHNVYHRSLHVLDLATKQIQRVDTGEGYSFNISQGSALPVWQDDSSLLAAVDAGSGHKLVRIFEASGGWRSRELAITGETLGSLDLSDEGGFLAYATSSRGIPPQLRIYDIHQDRDLAVESPNQHLAGSWTLAAATDADFEGPAGETIEAWFYEPSADVGDEKTPLVVYYYGGASPTSKSFSTTHQWITANGYALLVINPRGAYGYGDAFADHHAGDWGPKAAADILKGVEVFLAAHPEIDGDRVGIFGGSYGGFMTQYLVSESDRFAAAVSYYGISDISSYWGQGVWGLTYGDMSFGGRTPFDDPEYFFEHSPLSRADRINTPLLLMHGLADGNVPPGESKQMFTALQMQDKPVEMVLFPGEDHGISSTFSIRAEQRQMMMEWFDLHLRGQGEAWEARWED